MIDRSLASLTSPRVTNYPVKGRVKLSIHNPHLVFLPQVLGDLFSGMKSDFFAPYSQFIRARDWKLLRITSTVRDPTKAHIKGVYPLFETGRKFFISQNYY